MFANLWPAAYTDLMETESITMNISLPLPLKQFVDGKVSSGIYSSASEFVREAIREKLHREQNLQQAQEQLAAMLREGLESGTPIVADKEYFERKRRKIREQAHRANGKP